MSGWVKGITQRAWEIAAETMAKPWDRECAVADLAYWDDEYTSERPSLRALAERWGWTLWQVRQLLEIPAQSPHNSRTVAAQLPHNQKRLNANNKPKTAQLPHSRRTTPAQSPHAYLYTDEQTTDIQTTDNITPLPPLNDLPDESDPCLPHNEHTRPTQAPISDKPDSSLETEEAREQREEGESEKIGLPPHSVEAGQAEPGEVVTPSSPASRSNPLPTLEDYGAVAAYWLKRRPGEALPETKSEEASWINHALKKFSFKECIYVIDWAHDSPEKTPAFLRDGGNCEIKTLFNPKNFYRYRNAAVVYRKKKDAIEEQRSAIETSSGDPAYQPNETEMELWTAISESFIESEGREDVDIWLSPCIPILSSGKLYLNPPNRYYIEWISEHYEQRIKVFLKNTGYDWGGFGMPPPQEQVETNVIPFKPKEINA